MTKASALPIEVRGSARQPLGMSPAQFLRDYWQKRPLLIRQAFPDFVSPIEPNDLAGLAMEETALSRLIVHDEARDRWKVKSGPLTEKDFASTPDRNWTLLVQDVDKWDTDVAALLEDFRFLPSWRLDDIMISYAEPGGGVGPHVDQYDVFLLQGLGQRHWAIDTNPDAPKDFRPDVELKQLKVFEPDHEWMLEPGDMLYLPPGVPHDGIAFGGPCLTISVGMRAPSQAELTGDLADYLAERLPDELRYTDPDLTPAKAAGEIDRAALARLRQALPFAAALDDATLTDWFGRFITRYRNAQAPVPPEKELTEAALRKQLDGGAHLLRHPWARMAWGRGKRGATLFVNGHAYPASAELAERLSASSELVPGTSVEDAELAVLLALVNDGHLVAHKPRRR
ncbi:50S ribosomal protein L16 3-hydroxylase [Dyella jiangningensis]|uniref:cupin domain-containing protein n=1 Tax=Dyella sp. AtDHG13 TaxID=1938897 RepID=UPI00088981AB|nr:cupin domain-containing protein [Dyella sp. AtDHG13]PXV60748.1 50S ribosomal protein L16 3-hydroxylase [Dyella sp. AtDHG13]SDK99502.1 50S ribosomal protein L16 3-hydroxylase [Dyella jiangningensis]